MLELGPGPIGLLRGLAHDTRWGTTRCEGRLDGDHRSIARQASTPPTWWEVYKGGGFSRSVWGRGGKA